ncbi:four-helix bundle copper-binding protein [Streptomyces sp. PSKA28]|uniref:Four-helix bundle copper-binding protein n=1 Tax=Streptomyces himalayensis subsp. himalayensis TaxID=2756131 RepID=A0A7W0I9Q6_9ACTN|nr:four-helix bundle copper-binding protein [Streptomyces himalayensis]MBA2947523.1 four-helix bundle copper-binding protein [Streptomyces himalayensis subsp. himalayensis]
MSQDHDVSRQDLVRFLEDRFACAQACTECARLCALQASMTSVGPGADAGPDAIEDPGVDELRRRAMSCAAVCDETCRRLSEDASQDEYELRFQLEMCRSVSLDCAQLLDHHPGAETCAEVCRSCARACADFLSTLG